MKHRIVTLMACAALLAQSLLLAQDKTRIKPGPVPKTLPAGVTGETYTFTLAATGKASKPVPVPLKGGEDAETKRALIIQAVTDAKIAGVTAIDEPSGSVKLNGVTGITSAGLTGEDDRFVADLGPGFGSSTFAGLLTGKAPDGSQAQFGLAFGYDGLDISSTLFYSDLTTQTVDGLTQAMFNSLAAQLPVGLRSDLVLNLAADTITFNFSGSEQNIYVEAFSTDAGVSAAQTLATTPEPGSGYLLAIALIFLLSISAVRVLRNA